MAASFISSLFIFSESTSGRFRDAGRFVQCSGWSKWSLRISSSVLYSSMSNYAETRAACFLRKEHPLFLPFTFLLSRKGESLSIDRNSSAIQQDARESILNFVCHRRRLLRRSHRCIAITENRVSLTILPRIESYGKGEIQKKKFDLYFFLLIHWIFIYA